MKNENGIYVGWCVLSSYDYDSNEKFKELISYINKNSKNNTIWTGCDVGDYYGLTTTRRSASYSNLFAEDWELYSINKAWEIIINNIDSKTEIIELLPSQKPLI